MGILRPGGFRRPAEHSLQLLLNSNLFETVELAAGLDAGDQVVEYPIVNVISIREPQAAEGRSYRADQIAAAPDLFAEHGGSGCRGVAEAYRTVEVEAGRKRHPEDHRLLGKSRGPRVRDQRRQGGRERADFVCRLLEGLPGPVACARCWGQTRRQGNSLIQRDTYVTGSLEQDEGSDRHLSRGFIDFQVLDASAEVNANGMRPSSPPTVREGLSYNIGKVDVSEVEGNRAAEFEGVQKIRPGQTYSPLPDRPNNVTRMEALLALKKGLNFIRVRPEVTRNARGQVVDERGIRDRAGRADLHRAGSTSRATTTLDQVIRRQFRTVEGDPFHPARNPPGRQHQLGFFSDAGECRTAGSSPTRSWR